MIWPWNHLDPRDRETFRSITAFLKERLSEQGTIDWALKLEPGRRIERLAVGHLLTVSGAHNLTEPWASAWRLIEESWSARQPEGRAGPAIYVIQERLRAGDRSGAVISAIVDLVAPRLEVKEIASWRWSYIKRPRKPKKVEHILSAGLTSGNLIDLEVLGLAKLDDVAFLTSLANALEAAVGYGLDIGRRLGWSEARSFAGLGFLARVYYTQPTKQDDEDREPDAFHQGIAPSVKLLHAVVSRISELDPASARGLAQRWRLHRSPVHLRLWAAMARDERVTPIDEVTDFLTGLDQDRFCDVHRFPEIAELRAVRFAEIDSVAQTTITARIQTGPPRHHWPKKVDSTELRTARRYWSLRELRRIEVGGGVLPEQAKAWLDEKSAQYAELEQMTIDEGFPGGVTVTRLEARPDARYGKLQGVERLKTLEAALGTARRSWEDDPAGRADDWINQPGNASKLLADLETTDNGGDDFPKVWNRFGWSHRPRREEADALQDLSLGGEAGRVLDLLNRLTDTTLSKAIEGICAWFDTWEEHAVKFPQVFSIWLRLWPIAVDVTNRQPEGRESEDLSVIGRAEDADHEPIDLDTLNTPAGKLVGVFLAACPSLQVDARGFPSDSMEGRMRDIVIAAGGRSGLIGKHRMIESLPDFLHADPDWAQKHLIAPLLADDGAALALWRAVARRTHFTEVLRVIGAAMAERANDLRLGRETRRHLVFSLVVETLHAFREGRAPAVPNQRIQQMLRTLDDEVRASAANAIQQFVRELSAKRAVDKSKVGDGSEERDPAAAAILFRSSAAPFLREVWPQERSLATPGVSGALADLPATSGDAFAEAVDTIARFLVPFECWSMLDYGLYGDEGDVKKLSAIDDEAKARALLKLLDLTIGTSEGAVIPFDLTNALDHIAKVAPGLSTSADFRRLATAARR